jgi:hypothetical protein
MNKRPDPDDYDSGDGQHPKEHKEALDGYRGSLPKEERTTMFQARDEYIKAVSKKFNEENLFDIIVAVRLHAVTVTACPTKHLRNFANATLLEAIPCGSHNYCTTISDSDKVYEDVIRRFRTHPLFIQKLREALIQRRNQFISDVKKYNIPLYESESHKNYRSVDTPWRVLDKGYMEREYEADDPSEKKTKKSPLCEIIVCYVARGPFTLNQNIYETHPIKTRTDLMMLLKMSGYKKPLILDFSCGVFSYKLNITPEMREAKQRLAVKLGVGGTKRRKHRNLRSRRNKRKQSRT